MEAQADQRSLKDFAAANSISVSGLSKAGFDII